METKNQNTNPLKHIKESFEINVVKTNLIAALEEIKTICAQREYVVTGSIDKMITDINLENSTLSSRKKLARKIYFFMKKKSRRTMSALLSFIRKRYFTDEYRVSIKPSLIEQQVIALREKYKALKAETEAVRLKFKEAKVLFKEKKSIYEN